MLKLKVNDIDLEVEEGLIRNFKDEIIERNKFDPVVKQKKNIPYLVDQHLLDKKNA